MDDFNPSVELARAFSRGYKIGLSHRDELIEALEEAVYILGIREIDEDSKPYEKRLISVLKRVRGETE